MVAHNAAGAGRSQTDGAEDRLGVEVKDLDNDGAMMPMVPQDVPVAKPMAAPMMKITAGRNLARSPGAGHGVDDEVSGVHAIAGQAAQRPREGQDQDGRDHLMKPLGTDSKDFSKPMEPRSQK